MNKSEAQIIPRLTFLFVDHPLPHLFQSEEDIHEELLYPPDNDRLPYRRARVVLTEHRIDDLTASEIWRISIVQ